MRRHHERKRIVAERVRRLCPVRRGPRQGRALGRPPTPFLLLLLVFLHRRRGGNAPPPSSGGKKSFPRFGGFFSHTSTPTQKCGEGASAAPCQAVCPAALAAVSPPFYGCSGVAGGAATAGCSAASLPPAITGGRVRRIKSCATSPRTRGSQSCTRSTETSDY